MSQIKKYPFLFPNKFRIAGFILLVPAILFSIFRFYFGNKPEFLKQKVIAIYSAFVKTNYFTFVENNLSDEICAVLLLVSLIFIAFSKEKIEIEEFWDLRFNSMFIAVYLSIGFTIFLILFVFGLAFVKLLILNIYASPIIYFIVLKLKIKKAEI